jgi:hypothetical protein
VSDRVAALRQFHETRNFGSQENLMRQQAMAADLYRSLDTDEARRLARFAIRDLPRGRADHGPSRFTFGLCPDESSGPRRRHHGRVSRSRCRKLMARPTARQASRIVGHANA